MSYVSAKPSPRPVSFVIATLVSCLNGIIQNPDRYYKQFGDKLFVFLNEARLFLESEDKNNSKLGSLLSGAEKALGLYHSDIIVGPDNEFSVTVSYGNAMELVPSAS